MPPEEKKPIHVHDIVRLNSGGPEMFVISQNIQHLSSGEGISEATLLYTNASGKLNKTTLDTRCLTFVRRFGV